MFRSPLLSMLGAIPLALWSGGAAAQAAGPDAPPRLAAGLVEDSCAASIQLALAAVDPRQRDYGGLCRYRADNAALKAAGQPVRAVFFGDSITEGWGLADPALFADGVVNRGVSGQTTSQMLVRFRQDVLDLAPGVVHILAGTNDIAGNTGPTTLKAIEDNLVTMVELARGHGIRVVLGSVLPASAYPWRPEVQPAEPIRALNAFLRGYAKDQGLAYVDYYGHFANATGGMDPADAADGVHPTAIAYGWMGRQARAAIAR